MDARCQCGAVSFQIPASRPLALYICHCAECRRQTSSAFGTSAIFPRFALPDCDALACYTRPIQSGGHMYCYFCRYCGTRLLHSTPSKNVVSVKGGCLENLDWTSAIHIWTKSAMVPIPEGVESYPQEQMENPAISALSRRSSSVNSSGSEGGAATSWSSTQECLDQPKAGPHVPGPLPRREDGQLLSGTAMEEDGVKKTPGRLSGMCELSAA